MSWKKKQMFLGSRPEASGGGDFTPIVKYDARAGGSFASIRVQTADGFSK